MNSPAKAHEPTMEEILASIRRIISDDDKPSGKPAAPSAPAVKAVAPEPLKAADDTVGQDDIDALFAAADEQTAIGQGDIDALFLDEAPAPAAAEKPAPVLEDDLDILELTEEMEEPAAAPPKPAPAPAPKSAPAPVARPAAQDDHALISSAVGDQVASAFGSLAHTVLAGNARTLDDIVREMLRPMLKTWLDDNLPPMVERLVRAEIERVARGGR
ncbi:DUF2497 domain-containing protein [Methylopila sp. M107]|uniref:PopZ family protein n=1 Tax=Methylopila sp. M107 TaxID=1101190 RepID=UPI0003789F8D|nr:DUF2497 domain-containing protein [Methylopila sp. M107]